MEVMEKPTFGSRLTEITMTDNCLGYSATKQHKGKIYSSQSPPLIKDVFGDTDLRLAYCCTSNFTPPKGNKGSRPRGSECTGIPQAEWKRMDKFLI
jgi:hypothetical protein